MKKKILLGMLLVTLSSGYVIEVQATDIKNHFKQGESIEQELNNNIDESELKISFEEFEKNIEKYKKSFGTEYKETINKVSGLEIIETNLNWNGDLDLTNNPKTLVLHHIEASRPGATIPVTDVHQWHLANGWTGIGYHFYVTKTGKIYRGRPENAIGAHAKSFNVDSVAIAVEGRYGIENMPWVQRNAVEKLGGHLRGKYKIDNIKGHGELMSTSCPGGKYPLDGIRNNILKYPVYTEPEAPVINGDLAVQYESHVQNEGWQNWVRDGEVSGTTGMARSVEGFKIKLANAGNSNISYRAHVQGMGWKSWVKNGENAGTQGEGRKIEGLQIMLEGDIAKTHNLEYRTHVQDEGWQDWVSNGEVTGSIGKNRRIEGIQVRLVSKTNNVGYQSHIQDIGWENTKNDGGLSGTVGREKRIEAIKINAGESIPGVNAKYRVHGQEYGWQDWISNGALAGTIGESKRVEAIEIILEGPNAKNHTVEYRVHVQNIGWMPWVSNGALAGTVGESKRIEAIEIKIK